MKRREFIGGGLAAILASRRAPAALLGLRGSMFVGGEALQYSARVEYLQADGNQYIDTGIDIYVPYIYRGVFSMLQNLNDMQFMGINASSFRHLYADFYNGRIWCGVANYESYLVMSYNTNQHTIEIDGINNTAAVDGVATTLAGGIAASRIHSNALIGKRYGGKNLIGRIYGFTVEDENGALVQDLIPVLDLDGEPKMFDLVTNTYPTHVGSFTAGPIVEGGGEQCLGYLALLGPFLGLSWHASRPCCCTLAVPSSEWEVAA